MALGWADPPKDFVDFHGPQSPQGVIDDVYAVLARTPLGSPSPQRTTAVEEAARLMVERKEHIAEMVTEFGGFSRGAFDSKLAGLLRETGGLLTAINRFDPGFEAGLVTAVMKAGGNVVSQLQIDVAARAVVRNHPDVVNEYVRVIAENTFGTEDNNSTVRKYAGDEALAKLAADNSVSLYLVSRNHLLAMSSDDRTALAGLVLAAAGCALLGRDDSSVLMPESLSDIDGPDHSLLLADRLFDWAARDAQAIFVAPQALWAEGVGSELC